jgi:hypothetical protein
MQRERNLSETKQCRSKDDQKRITKRRLQINKP